MADLSRPAKKRKADATTDRHWEAAQAQAEDLDEAVDEKQTKEPSQASHAAYGPSMAPYEASELVNFSKDRLVQYIVELQEEVGKVRAEGSIKAEEDIIRTGSLIKAEEEPNHTLMTATMMKQESKAGGLPFFGDAGPGVDLEREKAFHLEVMENRATMKRYMLQLFRKKESSNVLPGFIIQVQSKRVIEELFGYMLGWEIGLGGRRTKIVFVYDLHVSPKVRIPKPAGLNTEPCLGLTLRRIARTNRTRSSSILRGKRTLSGIPLQVH